MHFLTQVYDDDEIVARVTGNTEDTIEDPDEEEITKISHSDAYNSLEIALAWYEQQEERDPVKYNMLKQLRDKAAIKRQSSYKQKKLTEFFK